jgi:hypothetical protein
LGAGDELMKLNPHGLKNLTLAVATARAKSAEDGHTGMRARRALETWRTAGLGPLTKKQYNIIMSVIR